MIERRPPPQEMGFTTRGLAWEWRQSWCLAFFLTFFLYWLPLVYMGLRVLQFRWIIYGLFYAMPVVLLGLVIGAGGAGPDGTQFSSLTLHRMWQAVWGFWVISLIHTWSAREEFLSRVSEQAYDREELLERVRGRMQAGEIGRAHV